MNALKTFYKIASTCIEETGKWLEIKYLTKINLGGLKQSASEI